MRSNDYIRIITIINFCAAMFMLLKLYYTL